ncbi:MAG: septum formation initiator family protein [Kofleriaceae bacterium]
MVRRPGLRAQLEASRAELRELSTRNARLASEVEALRTDVTAIEAHARDELGMVYPGELVLRIERTPTGAAP